MPLKGKKNYSKMAKKAVSKMVPAPANGIKTLKPVMNPDLKKYVERIVKTTEEVKISNQEIAYRTPINGSGFDVQGLPPYGFNSTTHIYPFISQGTGIADRTGNKIRPTKCFIRGYIRASPISAIGGNNAWPNEPFYVRLVLYRPKANMSVNTNNDIMDNGNGTEFFNGELDGMLLPYNKEKYLIGYSKTFKLQAPAGSAGTLVNNDIGGLPVSVFFRIKVPTPKTFTYVDTQTSPSNSRWYLSAGVVNTSGNLAAASDIRATISAESLLYFTDA